VVVYNITIQVNWSIHEAWLVWIKEEHIHDVLSTGQFTHHRVLKLLEQDETDGPTYAIQFFASTLANYQYYIDHHAQALREKSNQKWGNQFVAFRTVMEVVQ